MQRAIIGDCVAWNPESAPQAIVMKSIGKSGVVSAFGCVFISPSVTSGRAGICT